MASYLITLFQGLFKINTIKKKYLCNICVPFARPLQPPQKKVCFDLDHDMRSSFLHTTHAHTQVSLQSDHWHKSYSLEQIFQEVFTFTFGPRSCFLHLNYCLVMRNNHEKYHPNPIINNQSYGPEVINGYQATV